jgi:hypothetical protein
LETLFSKSPQEYTSHFYSGNPFNEAIILGDFIRQRTRPNEEIAVFGSEAEIYFYAQRKSATGYLFMYEIVKKHSYTELWRGELLDQISKNKPKMIVWVNNPLSWLPESEDLINPIINGLNKQIVNYHPVLIMDMINSTLTVIKQDDEVMDYKPQSDYFLMVFERNQ